jgi:hypothetical protein
MSLRNREQSLADLFQCNLVKMWLELVFAACLACAAAAALCATLSLLNPINDSSLPHSSYRIDRSSRQ